MSRQAATVSMDLVKILLLHASNLGMNPALIVQSTGASLPEVDNPDTRVPFCQYQAMWRETARLSDDACFGLHFGEAAGQISTGGILPSVMMNSATVGQALEKLARYHGLVTDFLRMRFERHGAFTCCLYDQASSDLSFEPHYAEAIFCAIVLPLRRLTQGQVLPVEIHFQ